jgi:hypothetical protein
MEAEERIDECGFSSAIGTEQADGMALHGPREPIQHGTISKPNL